jgi:general secretion pathway protein G
MHTRLVVLVLLILGGLATSGGGWGCNRKRPPPRRIRSVADIAPRVLTALDRYRKVLGRFPTTAEGLEALLSPPSSFADKAEEWPLVTGGRHALQDPWGNPFRYECPGIHNPGSYDLYSFGPDGQEGGDDDIGNWPNR